MDPSGAVAVAVQILRLLPLLQLPVLDGSHSPFFILHAQEATKVPKEYLVLGSMVVSAIFLVFFIGLGGLTAMIGFGYPAFKSFQAIETKSKGDDTQWLVYWVIFAFFSIVETFVGAYAIYFRASAAHLLACYHARSPALSLAIFPSITHTPYRLPLVLDSLLLRLQTRLLALGHAAANPGRHVSLRQFPQGLFEKERIAHRRGHGGRQEKRGQHCVGDCRSDERYCGIGGGRWIGSQERQLENETDGRRAANGWISLGKHFTSMADGWMEM